MHSHLLDLLHHIVVYVSKWSEMYYDINLYVTGLTIAGIELQEAVLSN
jgi:hypothetical protein